MNITMKKGQIHHSRNLNIFKLPTYKLEGYRENMGSRYGCVDSVFYAE